MNPVAYEQREGDADPRAAERLPRRPRRRYLNKRTLALTAALTCAAGFFAGVLVEKGQISSSPTSSGASAFSALAARLRSGGGGRAGFAGAGLGGGGAGAAGATFGTIASMSGHTLYVTESSGDTIKVTLSSATQVTKSLGVVRTALHPGDTVVIRGAQNSAGRLVAATVSDSGAGASSSSGGSSSGGSSSGGSSSGGGSGLSSLFSSGG